MTQGPFVDWISVSQQHGEDCPEYVGSVRVVLSGKAPGPVRRGDDVECVETGGACSVPGSYSSSLQIKAHRGRVAVSGNPSRFNRPDNLFGLDLDESMLVINVQLAALGLPPFTVGNRLADHGSPGASLRLVEPDGMGACPAARWTGAAFSRIDVTQNFSTGSEFAARLAIRSYQSRAAAYLKKQVYGEETAMWHNTRRSVKAYRKGPDMLVHCKDSPWITWANETGIVRHEVALKSRLLSATGLRYWGNLDMATLHRLFDSETEILRRPDASLDPLAVEQCPGRSRVVYAAWLRGEDVRALLPRPTFYRHRRVLRDVAHVDIAEPRRVADVVVMPRRIELRPAVAPAGYWEQAA